MNKKIIHSIFSKWMLFIISLMLIYPSAYTYSQNQTNIKYTKPVKRNAWSLGLNYAENGFGPYVSLFANIGKTTDMNFSLSVSGVTDSREIDRYDVYGNSITVGKINRVFMVPLCIGIRKEMFKDDIDGDFTPLLNFGVAPTLVLTNPYYQSFFTALGNMSPHFAFGGYAGVGVSFSQSKTLSMNVSLNYFYLPIIGNSVQSLQYNTIDNVGGFQLAFGVNFLK